MAKISIVEKLKRVNHKELEFVSVNADKDRDGKLIAILTLATPIPYVRGSQNVDLGGGETIQLAATDVTEVKIHEEDMNDDFQFDEVGDTGTYSGSDLVLDVSKRGDVWMKKSTFASQAIGFRNQARNSRIKALFDQKASEKAGNTGTSSKGEPALQDEGSGKR